MGLYLPMLCNAQTFSKVYDYTGGERGWAITTFDSNIIVNVLDNCARPCTHTLKIDGKDGAIINSNYFSEPDNSIWCDRGLIRYGNLFYATGNYSNNLSGTRGFLLLYNDNLDSVRLSIYKDSIYKTVSYHIEGIGDNIYTWGLSGIDNSFSQCLLICSDLDGNEKWMKRYKDDYKFSSKGNITRSHDGQLITCSRSKPDLEPFRGVVRKLDTLGNELWKKEYGWNFSEDQLINICRLGTDKYLLVYYKDTLIWYPETQTFILEPATAFVLDKNGELLAEHFLARPSLYRNYIGITPTRDGGAIAVGSLQKFFDSGIITRFDSLGNVVWEKWYEDPEYYKTQGDTIFEGSLGSVVEMPDGRIAAAGMIFGPVEKGNANVWVVMLDSLGCIKPGCGDGLQLIDPQTAIEWEASLSGVMKLYPNPAHSQVQLAILGDGIIGNAERLEIWSIDGRRRYEQQLAPDFSEQTIPITGWAPGLYIVRLQDASGRTIGIERLVVE